MYGAAPLGDDLIGSLVANDWRLPVESVEYLAIGYGSFHWLVTSAGGTRWLVTADAEDGPFAVAAAHRVARHLADDGLDFVRPPLPAATSAVVVAADSWLVSVWPWLDGRSSTSGGHESSADLEATLRCVRRLLDPVPELVENWDLDGRETLVRLLCGEGWGSGPYVREARRLTVGGRARIERDLARYDELANTSRATEFEFVVTHGEPHAANVIHTSGGAQLIDWDTVRWAPRERDLWTLADQHGFRAGYGEMALSTEAIEIYELQWVLTEIAEFAAALAVADEANPDLDIAMREMSTYLGGG